MRAMGMGFCWIVTGLLFVAGCRNTGPDLKPPPEPDHISIPPRDDPRYSNLPTYPKEALFDDGIPKSFKSSIKAPGPMRTGAGQSTGF